jgi:5-methylcytosine-specific restriction protein A
VKPRLSASTRGYDRTWQRLRLRYLKENPLCVECKREGRISLAEEVDHITPISAGGSRLDDSNLQSLCGTHHRQKTWREMRGT